MTNEIDDSQIQIWDEAWHDYAEACIHGAETGTLISDPELLARFDHSFHRILNHLFTSTKSKDVLDYFYFSNLPVQWDRSVTGKSKKMNSEFALGLGYDGFYLSTRLSNECNIKSMTDSFWCLFSDLSKIGLFKWHEESIPCTESYKQLTKLCKRSNSQIFKFISSYTIQELACDDNLNMGTLEVQWPPDIDLRILLAEAGQAFAIMYQLNYKLYKVSYLSARRNKCLT